MNPRRETRIRSVLAALALSLAAGPADALPRLMPVESESRADGAGGIVFDTARLPPLDGAGGTSLMSFSLGDSEVEFVAEGWWKSSLTGGAGLAGGFGKAWGGDLETPVFSQEVDLSLFLMLDRKWYFEADFADGFARNTVAAGYEGDGVVRSVRVANRGIRFPGIYSIDFLGLGIGGGENQAPGVSASFAGEGWRADAAVRYDMVEGASKEWVGRSTVETREVALSSWEAGSWFVLPGDMAARVRKVLVESRTGSAEDADGRRYRELSPAEFLLVPSRKSVLLSADAKAGRSGGRLPAVAFVVDGIGSDGQILAEFWERTEKWFKGEDESGPDAAAFSHFGSDVSAAVVRVGGEAALLVQHPSGFSPFLAAHRYDAGSVSQADAAVASKSAGTAATQFSVEVSQADITFARSDFYREGHSYATVSLGGGEKSPDDPRFRFPLAGSNPEAYLGGGSARNDRILRVRSYTQAARYDIGTKAVAGTVRVYRNGVLDAGAKYDEESGTITPSVAVGAGDTLRATWLEEGDGGGAAAGAAGFAYDISERWRADVSAAARWTRPGDGAAKSGAESGAYAAVAAGAAYGGEALSLRAAGSAAVETDNTSGLLRLLGMDDAATETRYLQKTAAADIPSGFVPILNCADAPALDGPSFSAHGGGSGRTDGEISGQAVPLSWDFGTGAERWTARTFALSLTNPELASAGEFEMAFRDDSPDGADFRLFLQLGVEAAEKFTTAEARGRVLTREITSAVRGRRKFADGTVRLALSAEDRAKIAAAGGNGARLVAVGTGAGEILAGPHRAAAEPFPVLHDERAEVASFQEREAIGGSLANRLCAKSNAVQVFRVSFGEGAADPRLSAVRYFEKASLDGYGSLALFVKAAKPAAAAPSTLSPPDSDALVISVGDADGADAAKISLPRETAERLQDGAWHLVEMDIARGTLFIDGAEAEARTRADTSVTAVRLSVSWNPVRADGTYSAELRLDELHLSGAAARGRLRTAAEAAWRMAEAHGILEEAEARAAADASVAGRDGGGGSSAAAVSAEAAVLAAGIRVRAAAAGGPGGLSSASHSLATERPLLGIVHASESFSFVSGGASAASAAVSATGRFLSLSAGTEARADAWSRTQGAEARAEAAAAGFSAKAGAKAAQAAVSTKSQAATTWADGWRAANALAFSAGEADAQRREVSAEAEVSRRFAFLSMEPKISATAAGTRRQGRLSDAESVSVSVPMSFGGSSLSLSWKKSAGAVKQSSGGGYAADAADTARAAARGWFALALPVQDLVSAELAREVRSAAGGSESGSESAFYSGAYEAAWRRQFSATAADFIVPRTASLSVSRDISASGSTSDLYQVRVKSGSSAMNVFGRKGLLPTFGWYEQDEFATSLSFAAKIPRGEPSAWTWRASAYVQATFLISEGNELKAGAEGTFAGTEDWSAKATAVWRRPAKSTLLNGAVDLFWRAGRGRRRRHVRTDSLNLSAANSGTAAKSTRTYLAEYRHETESELTEHVSLTTSLGASYSATWGTLAKLGATAGIGVTVKF